MLHTTKLIYKLERHICDMIVLLNLPEAQNKGINVPQKGFMSSKKLKKKKMPLKLIVISIIFKVWL